MTRYFIQLAYCGTHYHGWQVQENTPVTVQEVLKEAMSKLLQENIEVTGCGRTDTGVHAEDYYAHFDSKHDNLHLEESKCLFKLNKILPNDIAISSVVRVKNTANARFDAISRSYEYRIHRNKSPFLNEGSWYHYGKLDVHVMNSAAERLLKTIDFTSFSKVNTNTKTNNCKVSEAIWVESGDRLVFKITADRFLRNMVRAIVGTLVEVGQGKLSIDDFKNVIDSKNRSDAGFSAPALGLYLTRIVYPTEIFLDK